MNGFLLDTNVVSMLSPTANSPTDAFLKWLDRMDDEGRIFLSVVTIHEIEKGAMLLDHRGASAKAAVLRAWLTGLIITYGDRILGIDVLSATTGGRLEADALASGHSPGMADAAIAGIANANDLVVITCNKKHFLPFGIRVSSPDEATG